MTLQYRIVNDITGFMNASDLEQRVQALIESGWKIEDITLSVKAAVIEELESARNIKEFVETMRFARRQAAAQNVVFHVATSEGGENWGAGVAGTFEEGNTLHFAVHPNGDARPLSRYALQLAGKIS